MAKINWCDVPSWLVHALNSKINILLPILLTLAHKSNCSNDGKSSLCPVCGKPFLFLEGSLKVYKWWWAQRPTFIFFGFCDKMKAQHQCLLMHGFEDNFGLCVFQLYSHNHELYYIVSFMLFNIFTSNLLEPLAEV